MKQRHPMKKGADNGVLRLGDLTPDPKNARRHTPRNVGMITEALHEVGAARSIVIDEDGVVLAGNATIEAAAAAGIEKVQVVEADGQTIVAVRRRGLTRKQKARLALYDNRTAELAEWDTELLASLNTELPDLSKGLWRDEELAALFGVQVSPDDPMTEWQGMPECTSNDLTAWKSIRVNFSSVEHMLAFAQRIGHPITEATRSIWYPTADIGRYADKRYVDEP